MSKLLVLLSLAALYIVANAAMIEVYVQPILPMSGGEPNLNGLIDSLWAMDPYGSLIFATRNQSNLLIFELNEGGAYTLHMTQPGCYRYSINYVLENPMNSSYITILFPVVPLASGITVANFDGLSAYNGAYVNYTFPSGVFSFDHASMYRASEFPGYLWSPNYGTGNPPAEFIMGDIARFSTLPAGTYRVYSAVKAAPGGQTQPNSTVPTDFTNVKGHYAVFAGEDDMWGYKGFFTSEHRNETNWYIGDIIATQNASGCFIYEWATVNAYSSKDGAFDVTSHPVSFPLTSQCFNSPTPSNQSTPQQWTPPPSNYSTPSNQSTPQQQWTPTPSNYSTPSNQSTPQQQWTPPPSNYSTPSNQSTPQQQWTPPPTNYSTPSNQSTPQQQWTPPPTNYSTPSNQSTPQQQWTPPPSNHSTPSNQSTPQQQWTPPPTNYSNPCMNLLFNQAEPQSTCGAFGDPHIIKFDRTGVTCGNQTIVVLADNPYFTIVANAEFATPTSTATIFKSIRFTYKMACNPITATFNGTWGATLTGVNTPYAYRHELRLIGNDIFIDALLLRFQVRQEWNNTGLTFGLSMPSSLAAASTGVCSQSCPGYEETLTNKRSGLANRFASLAVAACDGIPAGTYEYDSCVFDVGLTGNTAYANVATSFIATKAEMAETWTVPVAPPSWTVPTPVDTPVAENPPTAETPTSSSPIVKPTLLVLTVALISLLF